MASARSRWLSRNMGAVDLRTELRREAQVALRVFSRQLPTRRAGAKRMAGGKAHTELVCERQIRPRVSPLVEQARRARRDDSAAALHEGAHAGDLSVGHRAQVRQNERAHSGGVPLEIVCIHKDVGDPRAREGLEEAALRQIHHQLRFVAPEEVVVALRVENADCRDRLAPHEVFFVLRMPLGHRDRCAVHSAILVVHVHIMPPRLYATGEGFERP